MMNMATATATGKTVWKYLAWTGVAAVLTELINQLPHIELPVIVIPLAAAVLKGAATWVATRIAENKP